MNYYSFTLIDFNKYINYLAILYAFTIPLSRAGIVFCSITLILLWIIEGNFRNKINIVLKYNFLKVALLLFVYVFLSSFWSDDVFSGFKYFERFWYFGTFFVLITSLKKEYIKYILTSFIISMLISEILSYGIVFEFWQLKHGSPSNPTPFMYHVEYSLFLAFTCLLLLNKIIIEKVRIYQFLYLFFFITATINLFLGQGRTGQLIFILTIFVLIINNSSSRIKALTVSFLLSVLIIISSYNISNTFKNRISIAKTDIENFLIKKDYSGSFGSRISAWIVTYEILKDNLIFGTGIGDIKNDYITIASNDENLKTAQIYVISTAGFHSDLLEITASSGIIGSFLFLLMFYYLFNLDIINREYKNISLIIATVFFLGNIADNFLRIQFTMDLFSLFLAIVSVYVIFNKEEEYEKNPNNK